MKSTLFQEFPPSVVLYNPRSGFAPHRCPSAATYTISGFVGSITIRPMLCVSSRPTWVQLRPPSIDLYTPLPHDELWRLFGSPLPTHTTEGSEGAIATAPIVKTGSLSNTGMNWFPALVVFHNPPVAVPKKNAWESAEATAMLSIRPPAVAGPI